MHTCRCPALPTLLQVDCAMIDERIPLKEQEWAERIAAARAESGWKGLYFGAWQAPATLVM